MSKTKDVKTDMPGNDKNVNVAKNDIGDGVPAGLKELPNENDKDKKVDGLVATVVSYLIVYGFGALLFISLVQQFGIVGLITQGFEPYMQAKIPDMVGDIGAYGGLLFLALIIGFSISVNIEEGGVKKGWFFNRLKGLFNAFLFFGATAISAYILLKLFFFSSYPNSIFDEPFG